MTKFSLEMQPALRQSVNPSLIETNHILSLPLPELERVIIDELAANPALEQEERPCCATGGRPLAGGACLVCMAGQPPVDGLTLIGETIAGGAPPATAPATPRSTRCSSSPPSGRWPSAC